MVLQYCKYGIAAIKMDPGALMIFAKLLSIIIIMIIIIITINIVVVAKERKWYCNILS